MLLQAAENISSHRNLSGRLPASTVDNPANWLKELFGGKKTQSGINVTVDKAISLSTFFRAKMLISEGMGMIPFAPKIKEKVSTSGNTRTNTRTYKEHFTYQLVARRPHPLLSSMMFRQTMFGWSCTYDNAYAIIERDGFMRAKSMFPIHPKRVQPSIEEGKLIYLIDGEVKLGAMSVFHIVGNTDNGITGLSRIGLGSEGVGKALAAQNFGASFFGKGINVSGFLEYPGWLKGDQEKVERLKNSFVMKYGGQNGQFGVGVLEGGAKYAPNEIDPAKAQLNENEKVDARMAANLLNMPVTMLNQLERGTFNNVEQLMTQFVNHTLMPWGVRFEEECWYKLLTEKEKREDNIQYKFNFNGLLRGDMTARAKFYEVMSKVAAYSPNDILNKEDENGFDLGDAHLVMPGANTLENVINGEGNGTDL